jgi:hypothetical protein
MKTVLIIVGVILAPVLFYFGAMLVGLLDMKLERLVALLYKKSESEQADDAYTKITRYSKRRRTLRYIFLGVTASLFLTLSIIVFLGEDAVMGIMMSVFGAIVTVLPLSLCLQVWLSYEVIEDDGILVHRVFGKRFVRYSDMAYYRTESGAYERQVDIHAYGCDGKRLVWVYGDRVGARAILNALDSHGIENQQINTEKRSTL